MRVALIRSLNLPSSRLTHSHKLASTVSTRATRHFSFSSINMSNKTDSEWRAVLSPEQFRVLREKGTERPHTGKYNSTFDNGTYNCAGCDAPLYTSKAKFRSSCGWPAFYEAIPGALKLNVDKTLGMTRTEMVCANCDGHLGHIFKGEGYDTPTDERHCVNSVSLNFKPE
ncbi:Peptide methionine sulfoxide reductase B5 [Yarrowia lipolytica]|nr:Peptide methionine sulfoxide reductase B5 [Yarrowia lipolytica]